MSEEPVCENSIFFIIYMKCPYDHLQSKWWLFLTPQHLICCTSIQVSCGCYHGDPRGSMKFQWIVCWQNIHVILLHWFSAFMVWSQERY